MNADNSFFGTVLDVKDEIDSTINFSIVGSIMSLNIDNLIFRDRTKWDDYFGKIVGVATSLLKMNEHFRKYKKEEEEFLKEFKVKHSNNSTSHASTTSVELSTHLDGFLSHFKSGLDTLATTFSPLLGLVFDAWHKEKDENGIKKSGIAILNSLKRNLNNIDKIKAQPLVDFISNNIDWVTYLVTLRDQVHHGGGLKGVSDIFYNYQTNEVKPQRMLYDNGSEELTREFIGKIMKESIEFFTQVIMLSLQIKGPGQMVIIKNTQTQFPPFQWGITLSK